MTRLAQPLTLRPRLDAKPWGGRRLAEWGIALPSNERIGEALLTAPEATVASGDFAGATLGELARLAPETWIGARGLEATGGRKLFPLLSKLIDAQTDLSVQVHPDDRAASAASLGTGKTETYHILAAEPGSVLYLGLAPGAKEEDFATACLRADGTAARLLRRLAVTPGMTILIPAGTAHAPVPGSCSMRSSNPPTSPIASTIGVVSMPAASPAHCIMPKGCRWSIHPPAQSQSPPSRLAMAPRLARCWWPPATSPWSGSCRRRASTCNWPRSPVPRR